MWPGVRLAAQAGALRRLRAVAHLARHGCRGGVGGARFRVRVGTEQGFVRGARGRRTGPVEVCVEGPGVHGVGGGGMEGVSLEAGRNSRWRAGAVGPGARKVEGPVVGEDPGRRDWCAVLRGGQAKE